MTHNADGDPYSPKKVATFVWFEYTQLAVVFKRIQRLEKSPPPDPEEHKFQRNIHLASFLLHARSLRNFLFYPRSQDDVIAEDFLDEWDESVENWCPYFHEHRDRLNKSLAHISYKRTEYEPNKKWECGTIHKEITAAWDEFFSRLPAEKQEWFTRPRK